MAADIAGIVVLILVSAFFAIAEISIVAARRVKLDVLLEQGNQRAEQVLVLQKDSGAFFAAIQIGMNAIAILGGIVGESTFTPIIQQWLGLLYQGEHLASISFALSFLLVTSLFILFADLIPMRIGMALPERVAMKVVQPMVICLAMLKPLVRFFDSLSGMILRLLQIPTERVENVTAQDVVAIVDAGAASGSIASHEHRMIGRVFELESRNLMSVMTLRDDIAFFDRHDDPDTIRRTVIEEPHNFYLVCQQGLDNIRGIVESKRLLKQVLSDQLSAISDDMIDPDVLYLPDSLNIAEALEAFKRQAQPFAVVLNEYSLVVGIVTLKDLVAVVMDGLPGSDDNPMIVPRGNGSWLIDGATAIMDIEQSTGIARFSEPENYETVAGFMMHRLKRLPALTDTVVYDGFTFEVVDMEQLKITKLLLTKNTAS